MSATANDTLSNCAHCGKGGEGSLKVHCQCKKKQWNIARDAKRKKQTIGQKHNKNKCNRIISGWILLYNQRFKEPPPNNWELMDPISLDVKRSIRPPSSLAVYPLERWKVPYWQLGSISMPIMKRNSMSRYHYSMRTYTLQNWTLKTLTTKDVLEAERVAMGKLRAWGVQNVLLRDDARWRPFSSLNNPHTQANKKLICFLCLHTISEDEGIAF